MDDASQRVVRAVTGPRTYRPGDSADFDRLYRDSYQRVLRTLVGMLGDPHAAEDCAQEAFVQAYRAWGRWRPDAPAEAWVHRIAVRVAISHLRQAKRRSLPQLLLTMGRQVDTMPLAESVAGSDALLRALAQLSPEQSGAIILRHHHGYSNRELAVALGIAESTVATRLAAARRRLAELLDRPDAQGRVRRSRRDR